MLGSASTFSEDCVSTSNCIVAPKSIKTAKTVSMLMVPSCADRNSARSLFHFCRSDRAGSEFGTTMCTASCGSSAVTSTNIILTVGLFQKVPNSLARVHNGSREGGKLERPSRSSKSGVSLQYAWPRNGLWACDTQLCIQRHSPRSPTTHSRAESACNSREVVRHKEI